MYKFLNWFFGWDYIYWENSCDHGVARVRLMPNGTVFFYRYNVTQLIDTIKSADQVLWLTCFPNKYGL